MSASWRVHVAARIGPIIPPKLVPAVEREAGNTSEAVIRRMLAQYPFADDKPASSLWALAPMLEAWVASAHGWAPSVRPRDERAVVSEFSLDDGVRIPKGERCGGALPLNSADDVGSTPRRHRDSATSV